MKALIRMGADESLQALDERHMRPIDWARSHAGLHNNGDDTVAALEAATRAVWIRRISKTAGAILLAILIIAAACSARRLRLRQTTNPRSG